MPQGKKVGKDSMGGFAGFLTKGETIGIKGRIFVPYYFEQWQILVPFEEYIPM